MWWTVSEGKEKLDISLLVLDARAVPGHVHLHMHLPDNKLDVYLLEEQPDIVNQQTWKWVDITDRYSKNQAPYIVHPTHPRNVLKNNNGVPRYVLATSLKPTK